MAGWGASCNRLVQPSCSAANCQAARGSSQAQSVDASIAHTEPCFACSCNASVETAGYSCLYTSLLLCHSNDSTSCIHSCCRWWDGVQCCCCCCPLSCCCWWDGAQCRRCPLSYCQYSAASAATRADKRRLNRSLSPRSPGHQGQAWSPGRRRLFC